MPKIAEIQGPGFTVWVSIKGAWNPKLDTTCRVEAEAGCANELRFACEKFLREAVPGMAAAQKTVKVELPRKALAGRFSVGRLFVEAGYIGKFEESSYLLAHVNGQRVMNFREQVTEGGHFPGGECCLACIQGPSFNAVVRLTDDDIDMEATPYGQAARVEG